MTPQEVIQAFMQKLTNHNLEPTSYVYDENNYIDYSMYGEKKLGVAMLDAAVKASSIIIRQYSNNVNRSLYS